MNFLEICQNCINILDRNGEELTTCAITPDTNTVHRRVIIAVRKAYQAVQSRSSQWKFHWQSNQINPILTTVALSSADYIPPGGAFNIRSLDSTAIFYLAPNSTNKIRMDLLSYQDWLRFYSDIFTMGAPQFLTLLPNGKLRVWPTPDQVYTIYADWYINNHMLINNLDVPIWHENEHDYLSWLAARDVVEFFDIPEVSNVVIENIKAKTEDFNRRYLPSVSF